MKKLAYILCPIILALTACNQANEKDYDNMATDICACVNKNTTGISEGMKATIINAVESGKDLTAAVTEEMTKNPEQTSKDAEAMMGLESGMTTCANELEKKYADVYTTDSEGEVQKKLVKTLKEKKGCEFSHAIMQLGIQEMEKEKK